MRSPEKATNAGYAVVIKETTLNAVAGYKQKERRKVYVERFTEK